MVSMSIELDISISRVSAGEPHISPVFCFVKKEKKIDRDFKMNASMKRIKTQVP